MNQLLNLDDYIEISLVHKIANGDSIRNFLTKFGIEWVAKSRVLTQIRLTVRDCGKYIGILESMSKC